MFREREDRRGDRPGRMDDGLQVRVVEVEHVRADAVHQRGVQDVHPLAAAEHAAPVRAPENGASAAIATSTVSWREPPTAQPTQLRSVRARFLAHRRRQILVARATAT